MSERVKIGITGVGGGVGQSIIKSLYDTGYDLVGLDGELLGTGLYAVPAAYRISYAKSPEFIDQLLQICKKENIRLLFPGLDAELKPLALNAHRFKEIGVTVVVSSPEVIEISNDKLITYQTLSAAGILVPKTFDFHEVLSDQLNFPVIVKQRLDGARSKNVYLIKTQADFDALLTQQGFQAKDYVVQEFIEGDEYTCGTVNLNGKCEGVIVMKRTLRDGDTYKCFSVRDEMIEQQVMNLMNIIKPFGACNVQLRVKEGKAYIFEINARCSGTTGARTLCGFNEPKMIADYLIFGKKPVFEIKELSILRYWKELVVENNDIVTMNSIGRLTDRTNISL